MRHSIIIKSIFSIGFLLMSSAIFASVTIKGYLYSMDDNTQVHFSTIYPNSIQSAPIVPYEQLDLITVNTKNLTPHTVLFTLTDDKGNVCDIGVTSVHMNTQFEVIHTTSKQFCVVAPAPNYVINIMPH